MSSENPLNTSHRFCVAPMLDWTDRHCRYFHRLLSHHAFLYTEMVTTGALLYGSKQRFLAFNPAESPVAYQLGGSDPEALAQCARLIEQAGYNEINLNVGCPSDRVQNGRFGACLMAEPILVAECVTAMRQQVSIPVTVKSRIGIDERDSYQELLGFITAIAEAGCDTFIIHARKAWLKGLSPKQNREVPPLRYDVVYQIKKDNPDLKIILNGGVKCLSKMEEILQSVDGVMVGREAYHNPYLLAEIDQRLYKKQIAIKTRHQIVMAMLPYIAEHIANKGSLHQVTRHMLGLFHGVAGARQWRRHLSENATKKNADESVLIEALQHVQL